MEVVDFSKQNSIINQFVTELRDVDYQNNRRLFRNNLTRIGQMMAFEISKTLHYSNKQVKTPLGTAVVNTHDDDIVVATIFRAGLPFHQGFLDVFDNAGNAFVSAYRYYKDKECEQVGIKIEYMASPDLNGKTLIIADPMLATGGSMELAYQALKTNLLRSGDTLVIKSLDRLSRNKADIKKELEFYKEKGIRLKVLDLPTTLMEFPEGQEWIFDMVNNILIEVLGSIAQQERETIHQRQAEGIAAAKAKGKQFGRPAITFPENWNEVYPLWKSGSITARRAMELMRLKRTSFYKLVKEYS